MSIRQLKDWLSKRRESRIIKRIREHLQKIYNCIEKGVDFFDFWLQQDKQAAEEIYAIIHAEEKTADEILQSIIDMLTEGETPDHVRADLLNFVRTADKAAGGVKRGTDNLLLLIDCNFPEEITTIISSILRKLAEQTKVFVELYDKMFKLEREKILEQIKRVDDLESEIDNHYKELKNTIIHKTENVKPGALIVLDHVIKDFEEASDLIEDCADLIRSITLL